MLKVRGKDLEEIKAQKEEYILKQVYKTVTKMEVCSSHIKCYSRN